MSTVDTSARVLAGTPVSQVLAAARIAPVDGRLIAVRSHRDLRVVDPARFTFGGRAVTLASPVDANGELHAVLSVRMSPAAEWVVIEIVKVASNQALPGQPPATAPALAA